MTLSKLSDSEFHIMCVAVCVYDGRFEDIDGNRRKQLRENLRAVISTDALVDRIATLEAKDRALVALQFRIDFLEKRIAALECLQLETNKRCIPEDMESVPGTNMWRFKS